MFTLTETKNENDNFLQKYLMTNISGVIYAFKIEFVKEIIPLIEMFTIDSIDNNITGLINLRGTTIPVYDIRGFLGKELTPLSLYQKFLIINSEDDTFALLIDSVGDIVDIPDEKITDLKSENMNFLQATVLEEKTALVINPQKFIEYTKIANNVPKMTGKDLIPVERNLLGTDRNRFSLLDADSNYLIEETSLLNEKFIVFMLGNEIYSFNINYVKEIKKISKSALTVIPGVPDFMIGIINFRGDYISLIDIKVFLHIQQTELKNKFDIVILKVNDLKLAIIVDKIFDITDLQIASIKPETNSENSFIIGDLPYLDGKMINMLNIEKLFSAENINIESYE